MGEGEVEGDVWVGVGDWWEGGWVGVGDGDGGREGRGCEVYEEFGEGLRRG